MKKGDLSRFIEQAVRAHLFQRTIRDIKSRNANTDPETLLGLIDATVAEVRARKSTKRRRHKR